MGLVTDGVHAAGNTVDEQSVAWLTNRRAKYRLNKTARLHAAASISARPGRQACRGPHGGRWAAPREVLRRRVRLVAAVATSEADFFASLARAGVRVRLRHSSRDPQQVTGYAVGLDGHTTATGDIVWFGGGRLSP